MALVARNISCACSRFCNVSRRHRNPVLQRRVGKYSTRFQVTQTDAGLATVIGHEVGHVVANHAGERLTGNMTTAIVGAAAYGVINRMQAMREKAEEKLGEDEAE